MREVIKLVMEGTFFNSNRNEPFKFGWNLAK